MREKSVTIKTVNTQTTSENRDGCMKGFGDILEIVHLLSSSTSPEQIIEAVLNHLCEKLGKRARCAFLEGDDLTLRYWAGQHLCPLKGLQIHKDSVVWDTVKKGIPVNLTDPHSINGYTHTLSESIKIKAIIPLSYIDPLTNEEKKLGALIVDSGQEGTPISSEEFEYLQVIGHLLGAIIGRAHLIKMLMSSCQRQETILLETAHNFRNRIVAIAGLSRRIAKSAKGTELEEKARRLIEEVEHLEANLVEFENYMSQRD